MAAPSVWHNWSHGGDGGGPLRPSDINWRTLDQDMIASEQAVFEAAWQPGGGEYRPPEVPRQRRGDEDAVIFREVMGE